MTRWEDWIAVVGPCEYTKHRDCCIFKLVTAAGELSAEIIRLMKPITISPNGNTWTWDRVTLSQPWLHGRSVSKERQGCCRLLKEEVRQRQSNGANLPKMQHEIPMSLSRSLAQWKWRSTVLQWGLRQWAYERWRVVYMLKFSTRFAWWTGVALGVPL